MEKLCCVTLDKGAERIMSVSVGLFLGGSEEEGEKGKVYNALVAVSETGLGNGD